MAVSVLKTGIDRPQKGITTFILMTTVQIERFPLARDVEINKLGNMCACLFCLKIFDVLLKSKRFKEN